MREREAWDSPAARATLTGIPPLKRASKQRRERQERKERRRRRREAYFLKGFAVVAWTILEAGVDVAAAGGSWVDVERARRGAASPWDSPRATASAPDQNGWGPDQIADEIRAHIGRLDAGAQATFARRRPGRRGGAISTLPVLRELRPQRGRPGGGRRLRASGAVTWMRPVCPGFTGSTPRQAASMRPRACLLLWVVPRARPVDAAKSAFNERRRCL